MCNYWTKKFKKMRFPLQIVQSPKSVNHQCKHIGEIPTTVACKIILISTLSVDLHGWVWRKMHYRTEKVTRNVICAFNYLRNKFMKVFPMFFNSICSGILTLSRQLLDKLEWQAVETPSTREQWFAGRGEALEDMTCKNLQYKVKSMSWCFPWNSSQKNQDSLCSP